MADRTVTVKLIADAHAYIQGVEAAERKTREATQSVEQRLAQQRQAFQTVGVAAVAVGTAITGIGIAALRTGIEYNTLQQTSRAALTSLLGSAEAANAQMDKLDDFARNSPFAKQVFIEAQQNMLAFGIAAENVIPYLDSIQNAVAAAGGSNQDIAELAEIFGKISASSKISAIDLQQFGRRGINAAELIGASMGKTGAQIREEITAGTLDADAALEALSQGMASRFENAADNVKDTFAGAMDRVKAAWRDFSSELARPLVNPDGGGALVDALNWAADMMRAFEALPGPVKLVTTGLVGLIGVASLVGGTFLLAVPQIASFNAALDTLELRNSRIMRGIGGTAKFLTGPWSLAFGAAVIGVAALNSALADLHATESDFRNALSAGDATSLTNMLTEGIWDTSSRESVDQVLGALDQLQNGFENFVASGFSFSNVSRLKQNLGELDAALSALPLEDATAKMRDWIREVEASPEQVNAMLKEMPQLRDELLSVADALGLDVDKWSEQHEAIWMSRAAMGEFRDETGRVVEMSELAALGVEGAADSFGALAEAQQSVAEAARDAYDANRALHDLLFAQQNALADSGDAFRALTEAIEDGFTPALKDGGDEFDTFEESGAQAAQMFEDFITTTNDASIAMAENGATTGEVAEYQQRMRQQLYDAAIQMGLSEDAAREYRDMLVMVPTEIFTDVQANTAQAQADINYFIDQNDGKRLRVFVDMQTGARPDYAVAPGGVIPAHHGGGRLPGYSPGYDDHLAVTAGGYVTGLAGGEWIINPRASSQYDDILRQINAGTFPGYADGGRLAPPSQIYHSSATTVGPTVNVYTTVHASAGLDANATATLAARKAVVAVADAVRR